MMSFAVDGTKWVDARFSNILTVSPVSVDGAPPVPAPGGDASRGIWMDRYQLMSLPTSGPAWERVVADAERASESAEIADADSDHDVHTMAAALVCVRTQDLCDLARDAVVDAIGTERGGRWLAVGRNLGAYVIAADLLDLRADDDPRSAGSRVQEWIEGWLTVELRDNHSRVRRAFDPFHSSASAAAQEGFAFAAVAAYLRDEQALRRAWDAFRTFACDPDAPDRENIDPARPVRDGWTHDDREPCAIDPAGARGRVPPGRTGAGTIRRLDGALVGDMRGGGTYPWKPGYPQDVWLGLEGFIPAAVILDRAGYPAFEMANLSVLRTHEVLWHLRSQTGDERWFDGDRAREIVQCELDPPALTSRHERSSAAVEARLRSGGGSCRAPSGRRGRRGARQRRAAWPPMDSGRTTCRRPSEGARGARGTRSRGSLPCSARPRRQQRRGHVACTFVPSIGRRRRLVPGGAHAAGRSCLGSPCTTRADPVRTADVDPERAPHGDCQVVTDIVIQPDRAPDSERGWP